MTDKQGLIEGQSLTQKALVLETGLAAAKVVAGILSGSVVLISDAIHSTSDLVSIATSWLGLRIAQKEPNKKFPYGYYKAENIAAALISFVILYAAGEMVRQGVGLWSSKTEINLPFLAMGVSLLDAIILYFFGKYEVRIGEKTGIQSLVAMGKENRTHLWSSSAVFLGIMANFLGIGYVESVVTIGIAGLILKIGLEALRDAVGVLMDVSPGREVEEGVAAAATGVAGVEEVLGLRMRRAGPFFFGEIEVGVRRKLAANRVYELAERVEREVKEKTERLDSLTVRVVSYAGRYQHIVVPVRENRGLKSRTAPVFGRADGWMFVNLKGEKITGHYFLNNPYAKEKVRAGLKAAKMVADQKAGVLLTKEIGEIGFHALREHLFDIYKIEAATVVQAVAGFKRGEWPVLAYPKEVSR